MNISEQDLGIITITSVIAAFCLAFLICVFVFKKRKLQKQENDGKILSASGIKCPRCSSSELLGGPIVFKELSYPVKELSYPIKCQKCDYQWKGASTAISLAKQSKLKLITFGHLRNEEIIINNLSET